MTVVGFHRKYMKHVFTSDELDQYQKLRAAAHRAAKSKILIGGGDGSRQDPLKQLEDYRASREGLVELKPYGIDNKRMIQVMSFFGDKELDKTKQSRKQLNRMIEAQISLEMGMQKRKRADNRSKARAQGLICDPTTSETEVED